MKEIILIRSSRKRHFKKESKSFLKMNPCHSHLGNDTIGQNNDPMQETARFTFMKQHSKLELLGINFSNFIGGNETNFL